MIGILTFHKSVNYGSVLQAWALQRMLTLKGIGSEIIDYEPEKYGDLYDVFLKPGRPHFLVKNMNRIPVMAILARQKKSFARFREDNLRLSAESYTLENQEDICSKDYEAVICGSDQIWNPVWLNPAYFLTFAPEGTRKIAYAPSLGISTLPPAGKIRKIRKWTEGFDAVSVRETEGADLLEKMAGIRADVMPDPVCLLSREEWAEIAAPAPDGPPYLLCYFIGENDRYWEKVRQLQAETGLRVLVMPVTAESYRNGYERLDGAGPEEFLGAIQNAACFCTDSFHGLAFGTIFGVRMELMRRYSDSDPENKNSRVDHFLRLTKEKGTGELRNLGRSWLHEKLG